MSHTKDDVIEAAGRLFARKGYHGTSMRDLGRELGLLGSSLYSHVGGKQELLVEVVERGAALFQEAIAAAGPDAGTGAERLRALVAGHLRVVIDHRDEVRTFLEETRSLDPSTRRRILAARDRYEAAVRDIIAAGAADGSFRADAAPVLDGIFVLSILNAVERWYDASGPIGPEELAARIVRFVEDGIGT